MNNKTYKLALFGDPVSHSLSPSLHKQFAKQFDIKIDYKLIQVDEYSFENSLNAFFSNGGHGANVTLPHKQQACKLTNSISRIAKNSKAVNTLSLNNKLKVIGDNTDGIGFINDLNNRCGFNCKDKKILILGAGGATQGIVPEISLQHPKKIVIANRTLKKAEAIATDKNCSAVTFSQLNNLDLKFDLIIHASSLGHKGRTLKFYNNNFNRKTQCYDLSYGKAALPFLIFSENIGVNKTCDGIGMLIEQAACAFEIWFGKKPNTKNIEI